MEKKKVSFAESIIILIVLLAILGVSVIKFGLSPEVPVLFTVLLLTFWARLRGFSWQDVQNGIKEGIGVAIIPIFIFMLIGALIGVWIKAGIIPSIMVLGFHLISGSFFVPSVFIACAIVGVAIGSGFTTNQRKELWKHKEELLGKIVKYKYFDVSILNAPRFPIFLGFRDKEDI